MAIDTVTSRRQFLKLTGIGTAGIAAAELGGLGFDLAFAGQRAARRKLEGTKQTASICPYCAVGCGTLVNAKSENGRTSIVKAWPGRGCEGVVVTWRYAFTGEYVSTSKRTDTPAVTVTQQVMPWLRAVAERPNDSRGPG